MEELSSNVKKEAFFNSHKDKIVPLGALVLVASVFVFRWGSDGFRSIWSATFFLVAFTYFMALIYKPSSTLRIRNTLVVIGILAIAFGAITARVTRLLYTSTGEDFIAQYWLSLGFTLGMILIWLGYLAFAPSFCGLLISNEFASGTSNKLVSLARKRVAVSIIWSVFLGVLLRGLFGIIKDFLWKSGTLMNFIVNQINPSPYGAGYEFFGITMNLLVDFTSVLPAVILCAYMLIVVISRYEKMFALMMAVPSILILNPWRIFEAQELSIRISMIAGPVITVVLSVLVVWMLIRLRSKKRLQFLWPS